jgi:hypothetical protein
MSSVVSFYPHRTLLSGVVTAPANVETKLSQSSAAIRSQLIPSRLIRFFSFCAVFKSSLLQSNATILRFPDDIA